MVSGSDGDANTDCGRAQVSAGRARLVPRWGPGVTVSAAVAILAVVTAGLAGCGAVRGQPRAAGTRSAASAGPAGEIQPSSRGATGSASLKGAKPPAGLGPDVTLAYFQHGVGLVGVAPFGGGWQDYKPSTLWLATGSGHWRDITPPAARQTGTAGGYPFFETASFLNPATGWVMWVTTWDAVSGAVTMYSTRDGGATWTVTGHSEHTANAGAADLIQLLAPQVAFPETLEPAGPRMDLQATADGGRSWRTVYTRPPPRQPGSPLAGPFEMPMVFISASRGFAADGISPADIVREGRGRGDFFATSDGGKDWARESPPLAGTSSACVDSPGSKTSCLFQAAGASHAWLTVRAGDSRRLYVTTDRGRIWHEVHPG